MATPKSLSRLPAPPPVSAPKPPPKEPPFIPTDVMDVTTQRSYAIGAVLLIQAVKLQDAFLARTWFSVLKWFAIDALWIWLLLRLRIPGFKYSAKAVTLVWWAITLLVFSNIPGSLLSSIGSIFTSLTSWSGAGPDISTDERHVWAQAVVDSKAHLAGQHIVKLSPISTAHLNPDHISYCLSPPHNEAFIPILLNNSHPTYIEYTISPLGTKSPPKGIKLNAKEITKVDRQWQEYFEEAGGYSSRKQIVNADEAYDDEYENDNYNAPEEQLKDSGFGSLWRVGSNKGKSRRSLTQGERHFYAKPLEGTQSITHIVVNRPGLVRLQSIRAGPSDVKLVDAQVVIVSCPSARFEVPSGLQPPKERECIGSRKELSIVAEGVAPLKLRWSREINGRKESFDVQGIEGDPEATDIPLSQNITIPVPMTLNTIGRYRYMIDSVVDGQGNIFDASRLPPTQVNRLVEVLGRGAASFKDCTTTKPISLLKGGDARLRISLRGAEGGDPVQKVTVEYVPPMGERGGTWAKDFFPKGEGESELQLPVRAPGTYSIVSVKGKECDGDVLSPENCKVVEQPQPNAEVHLESIHECSGDVGVKASLTLYGTAPFTVYYTQQRGRENPRKMHKTIANSREEIILQPESSGDYTYSFTHISDRNYKQIPLSGSGLSIKQLVHPLAAADFVRSQGQRVNSCSGKTVDVDVDLRGTPPWSLDLEIIDPSGSKLVTRSKLQSSRSRLTIPVPEDIDANGGSFQVGLVSVVDASGCKRNIKVAPISVDIQRSSATARFYSADGLREITILQGDTASLPLRLTGEPPWSLSYKRRENPSDIMKLRVANPNDEIRVREMGTYELTDVRDVNCPGTLVPSESTYKVQWIPRPTIYFASTAGQAARNKSIIRPPVCEGQIDYAELDLTGRPPFQISYEYAGPEGRTVQPMAFNSVQNKARLHLETKIGGRHMYRLGAVGDALYPTNTDSTHHVSGQTLEQTVYTRPTAYFEHRERLSYCLGDSLTPHARHQPNGVVTLKGQPPFQLTVSIKNFATNQELKESVTVKNHEWHVNFPTYRFDTIGPTLLTIESMKDSSPCDAAAVDDSRRMLWVDVAETAAVLPFDRKRDYCVGEPISLQLEGMPPWTVKYSLNRHTREATSTTSKFSRVPTEPGVFKVLSIAHQRNMCQTTVEGIEMEVHDIPAASVSKGGLTQDTIREGDQATITFQLKGTPPFTFTYQRSELPRTDKKHAVPQVLETHTVSGVMSHSYIVHSASEGIWTVTFIADKFCRYPANPPDSSMETI